MTTRGQILLVALLLGCGVLLVLTGHDEQGGLLLAAAVGFVGGRHVGVVTERRRTGGST